MHVLILTASPRKNGNTNALVRAFCEELDDNGAKQAGCDKKRLDEQTGCVKNEIGTVRYEVVNLYDMQIEPCLACRHCQENWEQPNCVRQDDLSKGLFDRILQAELIVLATPVYSWYCTAPAKALLDRCVYATNKYYGTADSKERGPSIWAGKKMALITTCGYPPEKGADLLEEGIRRYCKHSGLQYAGMLCERHMGYAVPFMDKEKAERAKAFARTLLGIK